jgi:serine/threonine protein kinase/formylglycine-generating enzyme required for sulfatase activity
MSPNPSDHSEADATRYEGDAGEARMPEPDATNYSVPSDGDSDGTRYSAPAAGTAAPLRARRIGEYELLQELGRGGMGVVYKARDLRLKRLVALKMIRAGVSASGQDVQRFLSEARAAARLDHPHIVPLFEIGAADGLPYFVMALVDGGSLQQRVAAGPLPAEAAAALLRPIAEAVHHAHEHGVIHRDLKPHNILLSHESQATGSVTTVANLPFAATAPGSTGSATATRMAALPVPKVTDFGLAYIAGQEGMTATGEVLGTPGYMPPEQASGRVREVGALADVYSLGAVLYCMLTGRPPFQAATAIETLWQVQNQEPVPPRRLNSAVPRDLQTICLKCLEKNPARRYASPAALAGDLGRFLAGEPILARPAGRLERAVKWVKRRPVLAALWALVVVLTLGGLGGISWAYSEAVRERDAARDANRRRVLAQVEQLGTAAPQAMPAILAALAEEPSVLASLREQWDDEQRPRPLRMRAGLALMPSEPELVRDALAEWVLDAEDPAEVVLTRDVLAPHKAALRQRFWAKAADAREPVVRLRALAVLAKFDPEGEAWGRSASGPARQAGPTHAAVAAEQMLAANALHVGTWMKALHPVREKLLAPLGHVFRTAESPDRREVAAIVLADYAAEKLDVLLPLLLDADTRQFVVLFPKLSQHAAAAERLHAELKRELKPDWKDAPIDPKWSEPEAALRQEIEAAEGMLTDRFALCQTLPLERFGPVAEALRRCGYRPVRLRPYRAGGALQVAAVWTRDGRDWQMAVGLSPAELRQRDTEWGKKGYRPEDVAAYLDSRDVRCTALWAQPDSADDEARLYVGLTEAEHEAKGWKPFKDDGLIPRTCQVVRGSDGERRFSAVWGKTATNPADHYTFGSEERQYESKSTIDRVGNDVSLSPAGPPQDVRQGWKTMLSQTETTLWLKPNDPQSLFNAGLARYWLGQDREALANFDALIPLVTNSAFAAGHQYRALLHARLGNAAAAKRDLAEFLKRNTQAELTAAVPAIAAAYLGDDVAGMTKLEAAVAANKNQAAVLFQAAATAARVAGIVRTQQTQQLRAAALLNVGQPRAVLPLAWLEQQQQARASAHADRAVALLRQALAAGHGEFTSLQTDLSFDAIRTHPAFREVLRRGHLERQYAAIWHTSAVREGAELHGLSPADHRAAWRRLVEEGYRPAALSVASIADGQPLVTASLWQRPVVTESDRVELARRQASAGAALTRLGQVKALWPLLRHSDDPTRRSYLVRDLAGRGLEARQLAARLMVEQDVSAKRALILALGEYGPEQLTPEVRGPLTETLLKWYGDDYDPGIHGAIDWLLRHGKEGKERRAFDWEQAAQLKSIDEKLQRRDPDGERRWYVNRQGQTMVVIPGPVEFRMGSPASEGRVDEYETPHLRRISRRYAIASKPVTVEEFQRFLKERPDVRREFRKDYSPDNDGPIIAVTWFMAAQYCNWLSAKEKLPRSEWCYPEHAEIKAGMKPYPDHLKRKGYRLPTEAEWEHAARAGALSSRYYGSPEELLPRYAWYLHNARDRAWPVGQKRPNDLGLFDMHGNVWNWCQESTWAYAPDGTKAIEDIEDIRDISSELFRSFRGGSFVNPPRDVRSAFRSDNRPDNRGGSVGFRPARTLP